MGHGLAHGPSGTLIQTIAVCEFKLLQDVNRESVLRKEKEYIETVIPFDFSISLELL